MKVKVVFYAVKDIFGKMKVRVVFFQVKDIFGKIKVKVVFYTVKDIFGKMKARVVFFEVKDIFGKVKVRVVGFYAELQTLKVTLSVLSATRTASQNPMYNNPSTSEDHKKFSSNPQIQ